jgi:hypothetical protein
MIYKVAKVHSNRFKVITNQFSYNQILINFLELLEQVSSNKLYVITKIQPIHCFNKSSHLNFLNFLSTIGVVTLGQGRN